MLANNLANASSAGYKTDREFYSIYSAVDAEGAPGMTVPQAPVVERHWTDHAQGSLLSTGKPLDLALDGKGFLAVNGPSGPLYTRNGEFRVSPKGEVVTAEGYSLRLQGNQPLRVNGPEPISVSADGTVTQKGQPLGRLELKDFTTEQLTKQGSSYFKADDPATAGRPANAAVRQGSLEGSNVNAAESSIRLIGVMRQFEALQRAITIGAEMSRRVTDEVAKS